MKVAILLITQIVIFTIFLTHPLYSQIVKSNFDINNEGWKVTGNGTSTIPDYYPSGGNPGGYISDADAASGPIYYFVAPSKFLGNKSEFYAGNVTYDIKVATNANHPFADIYLNGSGITIYHNFSNNPVTSWTTYSLTLDVNAGWINETTELPATASEILAVLSALDTLKILGDHSGLSGERTSIDNVTIMGVNGYLELLSPNGGEVWRVGTVQNIKWNFYLVENIQIDYSTNNGIDWILIEDSTLNNGSYYWYIPETPSYESRVRISSLNNGSVTDQSEGFFTIVQNSLYIMSDFENDSEGWTMVNNGSSVIPDYHLTGGNPGAYIADNDAAGGPVYYFVAPSKFLDNQSDFYGGTISYDMKVSANSNQDFPDIYLTGNTTTIYYNLPYSPVTHWISYCISLTDSVGWMKLSSGLPATELEILNVLSSLDTFKITGDYYSGLPGDTTSIDNVAFNQTHLNTFPLVINVANGWNMVSIPGLHPIDQNINTWWSGRDPAANVFKFAGNYQSVTFMTPTEGYWMKNLGSQNYNTGDEWTGCGIDIIFHNPINGSSGWNLIGGYEISATASLVTTIPPGLQSGPIYKYSGGYQVATTLDPGYGYWMKLSSAAQIIIPETMAKGEVVEYFPEDWGRIILTDATDISYILYAVRDDSPTGEASVNLDSYELPPAPMAGMFDIRFSSGRIAEDLSTSQSIEMSGIEYPVRIKVENMNITLQDESGKVINAEIKPGEEITIDNSSINKLLVISGKLIAPIVYALEQNYPNPFNPSTKIRFSIPKEGQVNLSVFNILGERIVELKNEIMKPGYYEVEFNASNLASGIYLYRIKAGGFVETKKMVLIK